jgi:hypothetical protein
MKTVAFELEQDQLFCPLTGVDVMQDTDNVLPSPAMKFAYLTEIEALITEDETLMTRFLKYEAENNDQDYHYAFSRLMEELKNKENWLCMEVTTCGIACGPISSTNYFCFDMSYQAE